MTTEHWLTIALIISSFIAQLIGPIIAARITSRANQPVPIPTQNQPKHLIQRIGGWLIDIMRSPWIVPPLTIIGFTCALVIDLHSTEPLTRRAVFFMALGVAGIWFQLLNIYVLSMVNTLNEHTDILQKHINLMKRLLGLIERSPSTKPREPDKLNDG